MFLDNIMILTKSSGFIIGPIANVFGIMMDYIYNTLSSIGITSLGWSIIIFTLIIRTLMLPLAFKQQKSMKEMQKIQPDIKRLQDKYKDKKDKESQQKMQMEMNQLYQEHGVNPFGGCLPLLVQLPIIMALFQVLRNIPSYIMTVKELYTNIATTVAPIEGANSFLSALASEGATKVKDFSIENVDKVIDVIGKFTSTQWTDFIHQFSSVGDVITSNYDKINDIYTFLGINLADKPVLLSIGILIPILNVLVQLLVMKTSSSGTGDGAAGKSMMYTMPLITGFFVISMPAGLGLYWLVGSLYQYAQQLVINKHLSDDKK